MRRSAFAPSTTSLWLLPLLLLLAASVSLRWSHQRNPAIGKPSPELDLVELSHDLQLEPVRVDGSQIVLLHFWGTWCPPCKVEYPELVAMVARNQCPRLRFLPVTCEAGADTFENLWARTVSYFEREQLSSPAFADPRGITRRSVVERLGQPALCYPTTLLIDPAGKIAGVWQGYTPDAVAEMESELRRLIEQ